MACTFLHSSYCNEAVILQVYYELDEQRKSGEGKDIAICRVVQLCPFPYDHIQRVLKRYPNAEVVWCQEEPMNMAPYSYIAPRLATAMKALDRGTIDDVKYVGRAPAAATATGFYSMHTREQSELVQKALQQEPVPNPALFENVHSYTISLNSDELDRDPCNPIIAYQVHDPIPRVDTDVHILKYIFVFSISSAIFFNLVHPLSKISFHDVLCNLLSWNSSSSEDMDQSRTQIHHLFCYLK
ncbi:putative oxoglutarate dehydrogenase [Tanacetum coccineum]